AFAEHVLVEEALASLAAVDRRTHFLAATNDRVRPARRLDERAEGTADVDDASVVLPEDDRRRSAGDVELETEVGERDVADVRARAGAEHEPAQRLERDRAPAEAGDTIGREVVGRHHEEGAR